MGRRGLATLVTMLCAAVCAAAPAAASAHRPGGRAGGAGSAGSAGSAGGAVTPTAVGNGGAVASMDVGASKAGIDVLKRGGNAVDAAVATASALGVTVPWVAGPGGGGFMVIYNARTHMVTTVDGRETCPAACATTMFVDPATGKPMNYTAASDQPLSTGVPSNLATWATAVRHYGRLSLGDDLQPAIHVAKQGFAVNFDFNQLEQSSLSTLQAYPASRSLLLTPSGDPLPVGTWLRNPDLAHTYELIARRGPSALYDGPIGQAIVQADDHPVLTPGQTVVTEPGIMSMNDLRAYRTRILAPTQVDYRGLHVYGMAPPSSGGSTEGEILNILNGFPLSSESRAQALFQYIEASRLAYADRNAYVGDPDFVNVPLSGLLDPAFAATRRCLIGNTAATSPVAPGSPFAPFGSCPASSSASQASSASPEAHHTNNLVTEDKWGDVVAYTNTINFFGGSGQVVPGYGFLLNNELTDFDFAPSSPGATDPNLPAPGKEPRSSMGPVIALAHGQPQFAIGAAGGSTIIETVVQTLINHVDFGMSLPDALAAPRVAQTNSSSNTSEAEPDFYNSQLAQQLTSQYGEKFSLATGPILPLDNYPGDATALQMLGHRQAEAIAEPVRLGGGSALALQGERGRDGSHRRRRR
jgi:gamma-glutamyltranspeptidase / glutathione hydrolase